jgi:methylmalonyl-CoA mutase N-terminal domain/subunit
MTRNDWEASVRKGARERAAVFRTMSGRDVGAVYTPDDAPENDVRARIGEPGTYPFTRGLYPGGYRTRLWTIRQFAGHGTPAETNARFRHLLSTGATGLSVAFDLPTLMGRDADEPDVAGEVGRCGVSVSSVDDMVALFDRIDLGRVSVSMTINAPAAMVFALLLVAAERQGVAWDRLAGTLQNDILKEFLAQKEFIYPPAPSMRLVTDVVAFCLREVPRWYPISISGYHIREAGATARQELSLTLADGIAYVEHALAAGLDIEAIGARCSFFFNAHSDLFEEIAKFRAARQLWATVMRDRFGARSDRASGLRFHAQTSGVSLTAQQPLNNVVRTTYQAMAAILGGASSIHTNALDEALALPTTEAATLALRTQQILAYESGLTANVDPFAGSWFLERLTQDLVDEARADIAIIDGLGGMVPAIDRGVPQRWITESAHAAQVAIERNAVEIVGVNVHRDEEPLTIDTLEIDEAQVARHIEAVARRRAARSQWAVDAALARLIEAARGPVNLMPALIDCARAGGTIGEMCRALRGVWGEYVEPVSF